MEGSHLKFNNFHKAFETLNDPIKRKKYTCMLIPIFAFSIFWFLW